MNNFKSGFGGFGKKQETSQEESKIKSQESETDVQEKEIAITITPSELEALMDKKIEEKLQSAKSAIPLESKIVTQIRNENHDHIPELQNFVSKERIYVLTDGTKPASRGLQTRHKDGSPLQYINPETKEVAALFYSLTQTSFFKEKHKGDSKVEHVHFKEGMLKTYENDIKLQKFLRIHPGNKVMGGNLFEEYNPSKEAEVKLEDFEMDLKARNLAVDLTYLKKSALARLLCSDFKEDWSPAELKQALFVQAVKQPNNFIKLANDPTLEMKGVAKTAIQRGIILYKGYRFLTAEGEVICEVARNQDEFDAICEHFTTGNGRTTFDYLKNAIG
jgi:hypothetical protein